MTTMQNQERVSKNKVDKFPENKFFKFPERAACNKGAKDKKEEATSTTEASE